MTNHEQQRLHLRADLIRAIGEQSTETLMNSVPPFDWSQVATKEDLRSLVTRDEFRESIRSLEVALANFRSDTLRSIAELSQNLHQELRQQTSRIVTFVAAGCALLSVVVGLVGIFD